MVLAGGDAAEAGADAAGHVAFERDLAGHAVVACNFRGRLQHRRRPAGKHLDTPERGRVEGREPLRREVRDVTVEAAGKAGQTRQAVCPPRDVDVLVKELDAGEMAGRGGSDGEEGETNEEGNGPERERV